MIASTDRSLDGSSTASHSFASAALNTPNALLIDHGQEGADESSAVQVAVRVRPMLPHEAGNTQCVEVLDSSPTIRQNVVRLGGESGPKFTFDHVFPLTTPQQHVYQLRVAPLVSSCLEGYNATILAYGQTGSGKTHTIMGPSGSITTAVQDERQAGVIPRAIRSIFEQLESWKGEKTNTDSVASSYETPSEDTEKENTGYEYDVRVQFLEVYGEEIRDLLTNQQPNKKLSIRDVGMDEPEVVGATETKVDSAEEALLCLTRGMYRRVTGATAMNESSSRSHAILSLIVEQSMVINQRDRGAAKRSSIGGDTLQHHSQSKRSKFNFVDLAGSERQKRTQAEGQRLKEGININQGLLVLGNVISALGDPKKQGKTFVPYRDSKLTRLLKGSLGGNHKTLMIACVSPSSNNMEETLNCLRYANRAKNIQNHAVVNLDATSRLVGELRGKLQLLATDLLKARCGNVDTLAVPLEVVKEFANGCDSDGAVSEISFSAIPIHMRTPHLKENVRPRSALESAANAELEKVKAENEVFRLKIHSITGVNGEDPTEALQQAFMSRVEEYEREIAQLKVQANSSDETSNLAVHPSTISGDDRPFLPNLPPRTPKRRASPMNHPERSESPELSRLRAQMLGSMAQPKNLDAEVEAEEKAFVALTSKYLGSNIDGDEGVAPSPISEIENSFHTDMSGEAFAVRLEAEMFELSTSINAKEELIEKLQTSQQKYEAMREFYEEKLKEMGMLLAEKEQETQKLSEELKGLDQDHSSSKELAARLKKKQDQLNELRRKQAELTRLTTVASRNETQIAKLRNEVIEMKHQKVELQKQIMSERKSHAAQVQKLKKESMQKEKELNKVKKIKDQKSLEAQRAQQVAKARLQQVNQLKTKYRESEKRLRMQTVKRGVMTKAGLDPVMLGRRQPKNARNGSNSQESPDEDTINTDGLRDYFDQKVADVGRREALAEKLAQEWEEHLELSSERDELMQSDKSEKNESLEALESQIKYKENRIRQLASRLGKRKREPNDDSTNGEVYLFGEAFKKITGKASQTVAGNTAAKVLFGMIVRERRRIASLARTASSLDEKVQEAEAAAAAKDSAFRAYVDEQRLEAAELAHNQQQHILSLMEMVREEPEQDGPSSDISSPVRSAKARHAEKANSKLLVLANERIAALEQQLNETQLGREAIQKHREREDEARTSLQDISKEYEKLEEDLDGARSTLRRIREEVSRQSGNPDIDSNDEALSQLSEAILALVDGSLHPAQRSGESRPRKSRRSIGSFGNLSSSPSSIRKQAVSVHTSDSDEVPDWADEIMKDLAIIAEGKMPSSLLQSQEVVNAGAQLEPQSVFDRLSKPSSSTGVQKHAGTRIQKQRSVFDRLTNPDSFTGVQKQRNKAQKSMKKTKADTVIDGQRQRKMISRKVSNSLDKLTIPGEAANHPAPRSAKEKDDGKKRSVFDRLLSPSNLTGTQKQRFHEKQIRRETSTDKSAEEHSDELEILRTASSKSHPYDENEGQDMEDDIPMESETTVPKEKSKLLVISSKVPTTPKRGKEVATTPRRSKDLDVFERLNRTTTQAYAVKQHVNIAEKMLDDLLDETEKEVEEEPAKSEKHFDRVEAYAQQNVFERLQKTTTRAYAVKTAAGADKGLDDTIEKREGANSTSPRYRQKTAGSPRNGASPKRGKTKEILPDSISNIADQVLDDLLDEDVSEERGEGDSNMTDAFSPVSTRLRSRRQPQRLQ